MALFPSWRYASMPAFVIAASCSLSAWAAGAVKMIANDELRGVCLATKRSLSDGGDVVPMLEKGGPAHEAFLQMRWGAAHIR